ncbi:hypothetical protein SAMN05421829_102154 [Aromatoleum tolulyticum]|uniref:Nickel transport protein n=1 Tax=Aromatoleum tolulyticum TaxID=34027 RepID=A0A1N6PQZ9_9RHOO|nr:hypothetical protein [Aromatoleum tolulyticum]SIQ06629.1 hypothetical protein SAMN05421829_102154 [Aromatoleum tolulyticum]
MIPVTHHFARRLGSLAVAGSLVLATPALAGPGHEGGHDHDEAQPVASGPAVPRFEAHSELFEVVGVVSRGALALTLDRYASNEPVPDAQIELESGSFKAQGEYVPERQLYRFAAAPFAAPGSYPVTLTITAGDDVDLLAADLVVPQAQAVPSAGAARTSKGVLWWGAGGAAAILALAFGLRRRRPAS